MLERLASGRRRRAYARLSASDSSVRALILHVAGWQLARSIVREQKEKGGQPKIPGGKYRHLGAISGNGKDQSVKRRVHFSSYAM